MADNKPVLLVCYGFPPNNGVGGRRWAKLAKYLAKAGHQVHVVFAEPLSQSQDSPYLDDVNNPNIICHPLPRNYPQILEQPGNDFFAGLRFRFFRKKLELKFPGSPFDRSLGWEKLLPDLVKELLKGHGISSVIATGAPFRMLYYLAKLKMQPDINFRYLVDLRDAWTWHHTYGMGGLSVKRKEQESKILLEVLHQADRVTFPTKELISGILQNESGSEKFRSKFSVLPHAYDSEDVGDHDNVDFHDTRLIYGGSVPEDQFVVLKELAKEIKQIEFPENSPNFQVEYYTNTAGVKQLFSGCKNVSVQATIGKAIFDEISRSQYYILTTTPRLKDYFISKIPEIIAAKIPVIVIGSPGRLSEKLAEWGIGKFVNISDFKTIVSEPYPPQWFQPKFNPNPFSFENQANELGKWINEEVEIPEFKVLEDS